MYVAMLCSVNIPGRPALFLRGTENEWIWEKGEARRTGRSLGRKSCETIVGINCIREELKRTYSRNVEFSNMRHDL